jgi:hypothetical protein
VSKRESGTDQPSPAPRRREDFAVIGEPGRPPVLKARREELALYMVQVHLVSARPRVWRELFLPSDLLLDRLHGVLQAAMGWEGRYQHQFQAEPFKDRTAVAFRTSAEPGDPSVPDEGAVRLDEVLGEPGDRLYYLYDPGDQWQHVIRLLAVHPALPAPLGNGPSCVAGGGRCPVEGIGGIRVWNEVLAVLRGRLPASVVTPELLQWVSQSYGDARFSWRAASRRIRQDLAEAPRPAPPRRDAPLPHRVKRPWVARPIPGMVAFACVLDGTAAGQVGIVGARHGVVVDTPWGTTEQGAERATAVRDGLTVRDAGYLHFLDPGYAPFWCPDCEAVYCGDHWRSWVVEGEDASETWGRCPRGHERRLA